MEAGSEVSYIMWESQVSYLHCLDNFGYMKSQAIRKGANKERSHPLKSKCRNHHLGQLQCSLLPTSRCWLLWLPDVAILFNVYILIFLSLGRYSVWKELQEDKMLFSQMLIFGLHYRPFI